MDPTPKQSSLKLSRDNRAKHLDKKNSLASVPHANNFSFQNIKEFTSDGGSSSRSLSRVNAPNMGKKGSQFQNQAVGLDSDDNSSSMEQSLSSSPDCVIQVSHLNDDSSRPLKVTDKPLSPPKYGVKAKRGGYSAQAGRIDVKSPDPESLQIVVQNSQSQEALRTFGRLEEKRQQSGGLFKLPPGISIGFQKKDSSCQQPRVFSNIESGSSSFFGGSPSGIQKTKQQKVIHYPSAQVDSPYETHQLSGNNRFSRLQAMQSFSFREFALERAEACNANLRKLKGFFRRLVNRRPVSPTDSGHQNSFSASDSQEKPLGIPTFEYVQRNIFAGHQPRSSLIKHEMGPESIVIKQKKSPWNLISQNHPGKLGWNSVIIIIALWEGFRVPMVLAFEEVSNYLALNMIATVIFMIDIFVNANTTFFHPDTGEQVREPKKIMRHYLQSKDFLFDLLPAFPTFLFHIFAPKLRGLELLRLLKLFRLQWEATVSNQSEKFKLTTKIFNLLFFLVLYIHCTACLQFYVVDSDREWYPTQVKFADDKDKFYEDADFTTKYLVSLYVAIQIFTGNEINPESNRHIIVASLLSLTGALIIAHIVGTITLVVSTLNRKVQKFQEKLDLASSSMRNMKLPTGLQDEVKEFMLSTQNNLDSQKELDNFMQMISPSIRTKVTKHIFMNAIVSNPVLSGNSLLIDFLVNDVSTLLYLPEDRIISQGEMGESLYLIAQGDCQVWVFDHLKQVQKVRVLNQGDYFGEVALLYETPRTANVKSSNYCTLANLNKKSFQDLCNSFPEVTIRMKRRAMEYDDPWKRFKKTVLKQIDYFNELPIPEEFFEEIHYFMEEEYIDKGIELAGPESGIGQIYFLVEGRVDIVVFDQEGNERILDVLNQGDVIGQYSALLNESIVFSAVTRSNVRVLTLDRDFFMENRFCIDSMGEAIQQAEDYVKENGFPVCDYLKYAFHGSLKQRFQRARRKATILEKSLIISSFVRKDSKVERTTSQSIQTSMLQSAAPSQMDVARQRQSSFNKNDREKRDNSILAAIFKKKRRIANGKSFRLVNQAAQQSQPVVSPSIRNRRSTIAGMKILLDQKVMNERNEERGISAKGTRQISPNVKFLKAPSQSLSDSSSDSQAQEVKSMTPATPMSCLTKANASLVSSSSQHRRNNTDKLPNFSLVQSSRLSNENTSPNFKQAMHPVGPIIPVSAIIDEDAKDEEEKHDGKLQMPQIYVLSDHSDSSKPKAKPEKLEEPEEEEEGASENYGLFFTPNFLQASQTQAELNQKTERSGEVTINEPPDRASRFLPPSSGNAINTPIGRVKQPLENFGSALAKARLRPCRKQMTDNRLQFVADDDRSVVGTISVSSKDFQALPRKKKPKQKKRKRVVPN